MSDRDFIRLLKRRRARADRERDALTMRLFDVNAAPIKFTDERKLECVERELKQRAHVYPRLVQEKRMSEERSREEIACMNAIADDYRERIARGGEK
jgi:hypothetical protein